MKTCPICGAEHDGTHITKVYVGDHCSIDCYKKHSATVAASNDAIFNRERERGMPYPRDKYPSYAAFIEATGQKVGECQTEKQDEMP